MEALTFNHNPWQSRPWDQKVFVYPYPWILYPAAPPRCCLSHPAMHFPAIDISPPSAQLQALVMNLMSCCSPELHAEYWPASRPQIQALQRVAPDLPRANTPSTPRSSELPPNSHLCGMSCLYDQRSNRPVLLVRRTHGSRSVHRMERT